MIAFVQQPLTLSNTSISTRQQFIFLSLYFFQSILSKCSLNLIRDKTDVLIYDGLLSNHVFSESWYVTSLVSFTIQDKKKSLWPRLLIMLFKGYYYKYFRSSLNVCQFSKQSLYIPLKKLWHTKTWPFDFL